MSKAKKSGRSRSAITTPMQRQLARAARAAGWLSVVVAIVATWTLGVPRLQAMSAGKPASAEQVVQFVDAPVWLKGEDFRLLSLAVQNELAAHAGETLLSRDDLLAARTALEHSGWITAVRQIQRVDADRVLVSAEYVTPFGLIRYEGAEHLIDDRGVLLPKSVPVGSMPQFMVLNDPSMPRPAHVGEPWSGADVEAGLALMRRLADKPWRHQIAAIDLSEFDLTGRLLLISDRGCRMIWGAPPGREGAREVNAAQKIRYLQYHFERSGHIDRGYSDLDLSGDYVGAWDGGPARSEEQP
jgi:hypothetical protein